MSSRMLRVCLKFVKMLLKSRNIFFYFWFKLSIFRSVAKYKAKRVILSRTGNTGPPETDLERALGYEITRHKKFNDTFCIRAIITIDNRASESVREPAHTPRG